MSDINGRQVLTGSAYLPRLGVWSAEVSVAEDVVFSMGASARLTFGDLALTGTIVDGGPVNGLASYQVRGGKAAWDRVLPPRQAFQSDPGVKYSTVFQWLSEQTGETITTNIPADLRIPGSAWVPRGGPAWDTLRLLSVAWYVDATGVTRVQERPSAAISSTVLANAQLLDWRTDDGVRVYQTDEPAKFPPGGTIEGERIEQVWLDASDGQIVLTLYSGSPSHGPATSLDRIVQARTPEAFYYGFYEYAVVSQDGPRFGVRPVSTGPALGTIDRILPWPGIAGASADLVVGSSVVVSFLDGRPSRPIICGYLPPSSPGGVPLISRIDGEQVILAGGVKLVGRETDKVLSGGVYWRPSLLVPGALDLGYADQDGTNTVVTVTATSLPGGGAVTFVLIPTSAEVIGRIDTPSQDKVYA